MNEISFLDLSDSEAYELSSTDTWFTDSSYSVAPFDSPRSEDFDPLSGDEASHGNNDKKTRVKWTTQEDSRLLKLYEEFPDQWEKIESLFIGKNRA